MHGHADTIGYLGGAGGSQPSSPVPRTPLGEGMVMGAGRVTGDGGGMVTGHVELFVQQNKDVVSQRVVKDIYGLPCRL